MPSPAVANWMGRIARNTMLAGLAIGLALMIWTWARAAAISADGAHYMELAGRAWCMGAHEGMDWYAGPGYPVPCAWLYGLIGDLDFAGRFMSWLSALGTLIGVGVLSRRMFGRTVACVSVALLAVHTTFVRHAVMAETDAAYGCWLVWSILFVWELRHSHSTGRQALLVILTALTLGLGFLTRPEAVPLAGLLCLWYLISKRNVAMDHPRQPGAPDRERAAPMDTLGPTETTATNCPCKSLASFPRRLAWSILIAVLVLAIASPYLIKLRSELGRWSLSGKERSIVLKFVPDKLNYENVLEMGITGALVRHPSSILHWLPYHLHWGIPQLVKSLNPIVLVLGIVGLCQVRRIPRAAGCIRFLLWISVPFILFFFLTFPGRRYFMQAMPQWTILAAAGTVQLAERIAQWRRRIEGAGTTLATGLAYWAGMPKRIGNARFRSGSERHTRRAFAITLVTPVLLMVASTVWGNRNPIESSLLTERQVGERILRSGGAGRRVLSFTVAAFYARGQRVPLWGPMQGIVRCHGYGRPLSYDQFVRFVKRHGVEYIVLDHDLRADCPEFLDRVTPDDFELVANDIVDHHGPHLVFRTVTKPGPEPHAN